MKSISLPDKDNANPLDALKAAFGWKDGKLPKVADNQPPRYLGRLYEYEILDYEGQQKKGDKADALPLTPELLKFVLNGRQPATKKQLDKLREGAPKISKLLGVIHQNSQVNVDAVFRVEEQTRLALIRDGEFDEAVAGRFRTKDEVYAQMEMARSEARRVLHSEWEEIIPVFAELAATLGEMALAKHDEMEAEEKALAEKLGQPYRPSPALRAVGQMTWRCESFVPSARMNYLTVEKNLEVFGIKL
jgi:hypothetical protein